LGPVIGITCDAILKNVPVRRHALNDPYVACVLEAGGLPMILPNPAPALATKAAAAYLSKVDGLLLTGGDDVDPSNYGQEPHPRLEDRDPVRDAFEIALARAAHKRAIPVLAICRGMQVANVALGGSLIQDIPSQVGESVRHRKGPDGNPPSHEIAVEDGTRLRELVGGPRALVNSYHHQTADRVAPGLRVSARTADGVVEALEDPEHPFFVGVQWHPERAAEDPVTRGLFREFMAAARAGSTEPGSERKPSPTVRFR
jgi:putative glutamine amidotransferase